MNGKDKLIRKYEILRDPLTSFSFPRSQPLTATFHLEIQLFLHTEASCSFILIQYIQEVLLCSSFHPPIFSLFLHLDSDSFGDY